MGVSAQQSLSLSLTLAHPRTRSLWMWAETGAGGQIHQTLFILFIYVPTAAPHVDEQHRVLLPLFTSAYTHTVTLQAENVMFEL